MSTGRLELPRVAPYASEAYVFTNFTTRSHLFGYCGLDIRISDLRRISILSHALGNKISTCVSVPGVEPGTSSLSVTRSNHLSYTLTQITIPFPTRPSELSHRNRQRALNHPLSPRRLCQKTERIEKAHRPQEILFSKINKPHERRRVKLSKNLPGNK